MFTILPVPYPVSLLATTSGLQPPTTMTMVFATKPAPTPIKPGSFQEYQIANQRMITTIQETTKYIQSDNDKEKIKARIEGLDQLIKDHKEFLREKTVKVK
jgi:hypothetical protein